jgi:beta-galactosidase
MKKSLLILCLSVCINLGYSQRSETNFNNDWNFILDDDTSFSKENVDTSNWKNLNVPHDWSFEKGVRKGGDQGQGGGYHDGGIGWYRKQFNVKEESLSNITYINFDGVYMNSEVWVNGNYIAKRPYGYISFRYDISKYIKADKNIIAVRVDNSLEPSARWYHPCGIYAQVKLIEVNPTHFKPNSIFIKTPSIQTNKASVSIETEINGTTKGLKYDVKLFSSDGKVLAKYCKKLKSSQPAIKLEVKNPKLWSPETPNLYKAVTQITDGKSVIDEVETIFGFKTVEWKTDTGFWLNGENVKLKGVCEHWEGGPVGGAWTKPMLHWFKGYGY